MSISVAFMSIPNGPTPLILRRKGYFGNYETISFEAGLNRTSTVSVQRNIIQRLIQLNKSTSENGTILSNFGKFNTENDENRLL